MGWASGYIEQLKRGETVICRPRGNSMRPRIKSGQQCTIEPLTGLPAKGEVVLAMVGRAEYLHLVSAVHGDRVQISNNRGRVNGWTPLTKVYGRLVRVDP